MSFMQHEIMQQTQTSDVSVSQSIHENDENKHVNWTKIIDSNLPFKLNYTHSNVNYSECNLQCIKDSWEPVPRFFQKPYPVSYSHIIGEVSDPLLTAILMKQEYQSKLESIRTKHKNSVKKRKQSVRISCYEELQELFQQEPDESLWNKYNWLYIGGNLDTQKIFDDVIIFHAASGTQLSVTNVERKQSYWQVRRREIIDDNNSTIYQIESSKKNATILVCVRQKLDISLYKVELQENEDITCVPIKKSNGCIPYIGLSVNENWQDQYATVDVNHTVKIWDTFIGKEKLSVPHDDLNVEDNYFAQVSYYDNETLAYVNSCDFYLLDTRIGKPSNNGFDGHKILHESEKIYNVCVNKSNKLYCYISTLYNVIQVDIRTMSAINKWSHSFLNAPFLSDFICQFDYNGLCVSSCKPNEKLILGHANSRCYVPTYLPTVTNSLDRCVANNPDRDKALEIRQRINTSTAGISISEINDSSFSVFSSTTLGDVFSYDVMKSKRDMEPCENDMFEKWNNDIIKQPRTLHFVDKVINRNIQILADHEPVNAEDSLKHRHFTNCLADLKYRSKDYISKLSDAWYERHEATILENIEQLPTDITVSNWLNDFDIINDTQL